MKYTPSGGAVTVSIGKDSGSARITITDTGLGMPEDKVAHIFDRFYRIDTSRTDQGFGLGLSIVKHVAMNHRGEVRLFSQPGLGSTFTLRLPVADNTVDDLTEQKEQG